MCLNETWKPGKVLLEWALECSHISLAHNKHTGGLAMSRCCIILLVLRLCNWL